jgi:hypothetical protein
MKVGLYARVSTHDQQTLPMQLRAMRLYAKQRHWSIVVQIKDVGSGVSERPQRERLLPAARRREINVILVWRLDRWGRSLAYLVLTLIIDGSLGLDHAHRACVDRVTGGVRRVRARDSARTGQSRDRASAEGRPPTWPPSNCTAEGSTGQAPICTGSE